MLRSYTPISKSSRRPERRPRSISYDLSALTSSSITKSRMSLLCLLNMVLSTCKYLVSTCAALLTTKLRYWDNTAGPTADAALCYMSMFGVIIVSIAVATGVSISDNSLVTRPAARSHHTTKTAEWSSISKRFLNVLSRYTAFWCTTVLRRVRKY